MNVILFLVLIISFFVIDRNIKNKNFRIIVGAESISAPVAFLVDMDGADMESAPTFVNMVWHNDKSMQLNIVDVLIVFCNFDLPLFPIAARPKSGCGQSPPWVLDLNAVFFF